MPLNNMGLPFLDEALCWEKWGALVHTHLLSQRKVCLEDTGLHGLEGKTPPCMGIILT